MSEQPKITAFGEILWDVFPDGKRLGGAPLNLALRLLSLKAKSTIISSMGNDMLASEALKEIKATGMDTQYIEILDGRSTGQVIVTLDTDGAASYTIRKDAAWDHIPVTEANKQRVKESDALVFGSLACREKENALTLLELLKRTSMAIFDLNLRPPHYNKNHVIEWMGKSHFVKMNDEELILVSEWLGLEEQSIADRLARIVAHLDISTCCVTLGSSGALLYHKGKYYRHYGYPTTVVDTVGAGDSFLATLIHGMLTHGEPIKALDHACAMGSLVAGKAGANAVVTDEEVLGLVGSPKK